MQQLPVLWMEMDPKRRAVLAGGLAAILVMGFMLVRFVSVPTLAILYSGLDPATAGEVVSAVEARGVAFEVRGDTIYVEQSERDALRMALAGEGLPANGAAGYELLDELQGFGTTAQMFDAAYWRAKEGELARTIAASPMVRAARVHVANATSDPFTRRQEVTASVTLSSNAGAVPEPLARSTRYLVASAVPGLSPSNVTVIDADSGVVIGSNDLESQHTDASSRAELLRSNIERLLTARVGPGNAMVEVNVELRGERETIVERRIDPESRVVMATDNEERSNTSNNTGSGSVTVASNLPEGDGQTNGDTSSAEGSETRERTTYDISEMQRETESIPGQIKRISVAVLINGVPTVDANGVETVAPRSNDELSNLEDLVRTTIGFDEERGDQVTIRSMQFEELPIAEMIESQDGFLSGLDITKIFQVIVLAGLILALAFGVVKPALASQGMSIDTAGQLPAVIPDAVDLSSSANTKPENDFDTVPSLTSVKPGDAFDTSSVWDGEIITDESNTVNHPKADPVDRLRQLIQEREAETVEILRSWMDEEDGEGLI